MNTLGIGTDIVEIARIATLFERHPQRFVERLLHENELLHFAKLEINQAAWLAKRFATKEAVAKALGTGIGAAAQLKEIETCHTKMGKPYIVLHGVTQDTALKQGVCHLHLSVADERTHAIAFVILSA